MKPFPLAIAPFLLVCCLASCVSGPSFESIADRIPPVPEHCGRIYCLRSTIEANLVQPDILLGGTIIGCPKAGGFFFVDRPAGEYVLILSHPSTNRLALHLGEKQTCYVDSLVVSEGFDTFVMLMLLKPADGERLLRDLKYTGPELPAPKPTH